jgi:hypothetical protein
VLLFFKEYIIFSLEGDLEHFLRLNQILFLHLLLIRLLFCLLIIGKVCWRSLLLTRLVEVACLGVCLEVRLDEGLGSEKDLGFWVRKGPTKPCFELIVLRKNYFFRCDFDYEKEVEVSLWYYFGKDSIFCPSVCLEVGKV